MGGEKGGGRLGGGRFAMSRKGVRRRLNKRRRAETESETERWGSCANKTKQNTNRRNKKRSQKKRRAAARPADTLKQTQKHPMQKRWHLYVQNQPNNQWHRRRHKKRHQQGWEGGAQILEVGLARLAKSKLKCRGSCGVSSVQAGGRRRVLCVRVCVRAPKKQTPLFQHPDTTRAAPFAAQRPISLWGASAGGSLVRVRARK